MNETRVTAQSAVRAIAAGSFVLAATGALAVDNYGTAATARNINCISADCSGGGVSGGDSMFAPDVEGYQILQSDNSVMGSLGQATVSAQLVDTGLGYTTMLQTGDAIGATGGAAGATGHTLEHYTYTGPATTLTINVDLTGTLIGPLSGADSNLDPLTGTLFIFTDPFSIQELDFWGSPFAGGCLGECYVPDQVVELEIMPGMTADSDAVTLNLVDGSEFYLYGVFDIGAAGGGSADAVPGFSYDFDSGAGLSSRGAGGGAPDTDGDGVADDVDNCTDVVNPDQRDTNGDGFGNACDADLNNDGTINVVDLGLLRAVFFTADPDADFNGDGTVNVVDLGIMRQSFFGAPGPSAGN